MTQLQERERNRDQQDHIERHVWGKKEYINGAGSKIRVRGTGTEDEEVAVLNIAGADFNLPENSNSEVILLSGGSDTNLKFAIQTIPRDTQRQWAEGTGGVQHPTDGNRAVEFNGEELWLKDGRIVLGNNKEVVISFEGGGLTITTNGPVNIVSPDLQHNTVNVGDDHKHTDVEPGGGLTGNPQQ